MDQLLKHILQRYDTSGRLLKWSIELGEFHIEYRPRMAIMAQALANFVAEFTCLEEDGTLDPNVKIAREREAEEKDGNTTRW